MYDPEIAATMRGSMKQIVSAVAQGRCYWYFTATVPVAKISAFATKMDERFGLQATDGQRDYARKRGQCRFRLVIFPLPQRNDLQAWVLRTEGEHPLLSTETWRDCRSDPIHWPWLFELRQLIVPPELRAMYQRKMQNSERVRFAINPMTWTWRFRPEEMERIRSNIRHWTQHRDERLPRLIYGLSLVPGFRGIRADVFRVHTYIRNQAAKRKVACPELPARPWISGRKNRTVPLSYLVRRAKRCADTWFPPDRRRPDTAIPPIIMERPDAAPQADQNGHEKDQDSASSRRRGAP